MKKGSKEAKAWGRKMKALRNKGKRKKSTKKGGVRKTARKAYTRRIRYRPSTKKGSRIILTSIKTRRKTNKARNRSSGKLKLKSIASSGTLKKVALGVGGAAIATAVISAIAPNSSIGRYAAPAGAYVMGGIEGIIGSMALSMLSRPTGNANMSPAMEVL